MKMKQQKTLYPENYNNKKTEFGKHKMDFIRPKIGHSLSRHFLFSHCFSFTYYIVEKCVRFRGSHCEVVLHVKIMFLMLIVATCWNGDLGKIPDRRICL